MKSFSKTIKVLPQALIDGLMLYYDELTVEKILDGYMQKRLSTVRVNTIFTDVRGILSELWDNNIKCDRVPWYEDALILKNAEAKIIERLDVYKKGHIYMQSLSSMIPALALCAEKGMRILDMASAPGSKTTQLAALIGNDGYILANEADSIRAQRLSYNIKKQGAKCVEVSVSDGRRLDNDLHFDAVLLDAPCSGSGTVDAYSSMTYRPISDKLIRRSASLQFSLLKKGLSLLKSGGCLVYSTCSVLKSENEEIIKKALAEYKNISLIPLGLSDIENIPILPSTLPHTLTVRPSLLYEGFFVAKLQKD